MKPEIIKLDWDSEFFNFNTCLISGEMKNFTDLNIVNSYMNEMNFKLAYFSSDKKLNYEGFKSLEIKLVDEKTTFVKKIDQYIKKHPLITFYNSNVVTEKLTKLAIQSGEYSRFKVDRNISEKKFEKLYKTWIIKSVNKEIAKEVIVYNFDGNIAGLLTVGEKNNRADVGIVAVDSKYRGKGFGRALVETAENWAFDNGYKYMQITTQGYNLPACKLYKNSGYSVESIKYYYHIWCNGIIDK